MFLSETWTPALVQTGPPCWANNPPSVAPLIVENVARLRTVCLEPSKRNKPTLLLLLGEFSPFDGTLQGLYLGPYPPDRINYPDNGASLIYSEDGSTLWRKIT